MAGTVEDLEMQRQAAEAAAKEKVDEAGKEAKAEAENKGLSEEEVNKRVEQARKEEKDKLYPQLEALRAALKEVQEHLRSEKEEKEQLKTAAEEDAERKRVSKLTDDQKQTEIFARLEEELKREREERERFRQELEDTRKADVLDRYREGAIKAAGDEIISELVTGTTEAEIDEAVDKAKAKYKEAVDRAKAQLKQELGRGLRSADPELEVLQEEELEGDLLNVDQDRYLADAEYRTKIKTMLARAYERSGGR